MTIEHYTYELRRSRMGKYLGSKVAIREDWVKRTRRYVVASGLDLNALATFVKKGLYDRRLDGFNEKALEEPLSAAQQWTLMWIILSDFGVPEWLRDESTDENVPEMAVAEPDEEETGVVSALVKPAAAVGTGVATAVGGGVATVGTGVATVGTAAADATVEAGKTTLSAGRAVGEAALSVAAIPVKTLSSLVSGSVKEAEVAIAEAEVAIAEAEAPEAEVPEGEEALEEVTEDPGDDQSGE
jgi:hypothetical protein